jgi:hypothetical protein
MNLRIECGARGAAKVGKAHRFRLTLLLCQESGGDAFGARR